MFLEVRKSDCSNWKEIVLNQKITIHWQKSTKRKQKILDILTVLDMLQTCDNHVSHIVPIAAKQHLNKYCSFSHIKIHL